MSFLNVGLDEDGVAKLRDFSCCVSIPKGETFVDFKGKTLFGYRDNGVVSEKTDVFAIGISMQIFLMGYIRYYEIRGSYDSATIPENDWLLKFMKERRMDEIADPEMLEKMGEISEQELCQMKAFGMLSLRCVGFKGEVPTMVEVAKELKKIQRCL